MKSFKCGIKAIDGLEIPSVNALRTNTKLLGHAEFFKNIYLFLQLFLAH